MQCTNIIIIIIIEYLSKNYMRVLILCIIYKYI